MKKFSSFVKKLSKKAGYRTAVLSAALVLLVITYVVAKTAGAPALVLGVLVLGLLCSL